MSQPRGRRRDGDFKLRDWAWDVSVLFPLFKIFLEEKQYHLTYAKFN